MEGVEAAGDDAVDAADSAAAAAAEGEEGGDDAAAAADGEAAGDGKAVWTPSWVRGGGGRGRSNSGRFRGIDPIIPVEDPTIIKVKGLLETFKSPAV
jgi:hypothetical protein